MPRGSRAATEASILVLAGLLEPCSNIGTEARYELLPTPWTFDHFVEVVRRTVGVDQGNCAILREHMRIENLAGLPHDPNDVDALHRGIGVRAWIVRGPDARPLLSLLRNLGKSWSLRRAKAAARVVDALGDGAASPLQLSWCHDKMVEVREIVEFESQLLRQLENAHATSSQPYQSRKGTATALTRR